MKPNSIASVEDNEENSEENSLDNEAYDDIDDNDEETYDINTSLNESSDLRLYDAASLHRNKFTTDQKESNSKKKPKIKIDRKRKCRTTFTKNQLNALECEFLKSNFISNDKIDSIMEITGLDSRIIKVSFCINIWP